MSRWRKLPFPSLLASAGAFALLAGGAAAQTDQSPTRYGDYPNQHQYRSQAQGRVDIRQPDRMYNQQWSEPQQGPYGSTNASGPQAGPQAGQGPYAQAPFYAQPYQYAPHAGPYHFGENRGSGMMPPQGGGQFGQAQPYGPANPTDPYQQAFEQGFRQGQMAIQQQLNQATQQAYHAGYERGRYEVMAPQSADQYGNALVSPSGAIMSPQNRAGLEKARNQLEQAGLNDVKVEDARYLFSASMPDGRRVLVIADPMIRRDMPTAGGDRDGGATGSGAADSLAESPDGTTGSTTGGNTPAAGGAGGNSGNANPGSGSSN